MSRRNTPSPDASAVQTGELVFLRVPGRGDAAEWIALREASREHLEPWDGGPPGRTERPTNAEMFRRMLETSDTASNKRFLICVRETGEIAGQISLNNIVRGAFQSCHCGYWIGAAYTRRGYTSEALSLVLRHAFEPLALHRVEANMIPRNDASRGVVQKCGLRREGFAQRYLHVNGVWEDHEIWAITAEEWRSAS